MMIFVTPKPGKHVRNPDANFAPLPAAGDTVVDSGYWRMHARDGTVTITAVTTPAPLPANRVAEQNAAAAAAAAAPPAVQS